MLFCYRMALVFALAWTASRASHGLPGSEDPPEPRATPIVGVASMARLEESGAFQFLVGGHLYGQPSIDDVLPSPTLLAATEKLAAGDDAFMISCGDYVRAYLPDFAEPTHRALEALGMPVYNAPGNHDWNENYRDAHGLGFGCFQYGSTLFVLLNSEMVPWHITGAQLEFLKSVVAHAAASEQTEHVFFFAHKLMFAAEDERYAILWKHLNAKDGFMRRCNFREEVRPLLASLSRTKEVFWFGGDVGVTWSRSLFYDRDPDTGVTYLATGIGSTRRDCLVRVRVRPGAPVEMEVVSLADGARVDAGQPIEGEVAEFGLDYWETEFRKR